MPRKRIIFSLLLLLLLLTGCDNKSDIVAQMDEQEVNIDEVFQQAKIDMKGQGYIDMMDMQLLEPKYSYQNNSTVKDTVDKRIDQINKLQPGLIKQYQARDAFDLLKKSGALLGIMKDQYAKDEYIKHEVTTASLRKLYNKKAGESINYSQIALQLSDFSNDKNKLNSAIADITKSIKNSKDIEATFAQLAAKYPGTSGSNGKQGTVNRDSISPAVLKLLDTFKENGHNTKALVDGPVYYFILRHDDGSRLSFAASKERLTDLQYDKANQANEHLSDYYTMLLRNKNKIKFYDRSAQNIYQAAQQIIMKAYREAKKGAN